MPEITPSRSVIFQEDVSYKRSVSEAILSKVGAQSNFINTYQIDSHRFCLNGSYSVATGIVLYDGAYNFFYNSEIVGVYFWNGQRGSSGLTDFDIEWVNESGGNEGSIFSSNPQIDSTASDVSIGRVNLTTGNSTGGTGITLPTLSKTQFLEGQSLIFKLNSAMISASNCGICIQFKPIN
jgi:hypothetical protein